MLIEPIIQRLRPFPSDAFNELFRVLDRIEKKYNLIEPLTEADRKAIEEGIKSIERGEGIPADEVMKKFGLEIFDRDAAGKESFVDAI